MAHAFIHSVIFLLYLCCFIASCIPTNHDNRIDSKTLFVGEELQKETLPLQMGSCFYLLSGLKPSRWYEVKISYPASIPTSFTIQLKIGKSDLEFNWNRRLLNTEKLIFRADSRDFNSYKAGMYVLVTVEPSGIVALPHVQERQLVIFNIVCDELLLGIPHKAWWVGILVFLCLGLALVIPSFLPEHLLQKRRSLRPHKSNFL
ncbi:uncharacterized protein LOC122091387 isoform X1 [Macadamia integrifolia]|uniref:uncharacterized protein LOC122091387 isoform X1 n=1 Tax=Macadamia integrifolia TaxID=60698 RepID=UPI001C4E4D4F|nr:uncharacterized protein LOC122091387 isoform X1 [Macadamia integrifolia]XP_042517237.1 uncharacterized protein LOC122091387 isoform X1 [Macadamia integrifolia]XP_042517246.1 uncharacterized protein LOC122091387 isoform X1 [Macadamia integrifolia]XP_042517255.1 uncharacterized protein LOC122091387 isoform X1 [Macadamia integrifolia]XP_042517263.1 uncharacterized protein LOC122091387 isoform X1 [Macadamia integrifolia]